MFTLSLPRALAGALLLSGAATAQAATLLVTVKNDSYDGQCNVHCSLRDAVQVANQTAGPSTILLPPGSYRLTRPALLDSEGDPIEDQDNQIGDLDVLGELRIRGLSTTTSRIKGRYELYDRLFEVLANAKLTLENLTLEDSAILYNNGGGVANHGQLRLRKVFALHNRASSGAAIANDGDLLIEDSRFEENTASAVLKMGQGGAIFNSGSLLVRGSTFYANNAYGDDIGEGSGIYNSGNATVESSSFQRHSDDVESKGGTITNDGTLVLSNSTLSNNNSALSNRLGSKATLSNVTITLNGTYAVGNAGELLIRNSIIAGNKDEDGNATNCINGGGDYSYQAIGLLRNDESSNCSADLFVPIEQTFTQVLSPTLSSDGKTSFHTLLPGSPAIDAGIGDCIAKDQRGVSRPKDGNGDGVAVCDLGAYELIP